MTINQALGEWIVAHPWLTFFVLLCLVEMPGRLFKVVVKLKS